VLWHCTRVVWVHAGWLHDERKLAAGRGVYIG
jgi:hypothetical protein